MKNLVVCEDSVPDLKNSYAQLLPEYNIHVHFLNSGFTREQNAKVFVPEIALLGFKKDQIYLTPPDPNSYPDAHYCVDSLDGTCFDFLSQLPKERVWVVSNNPPIRDVAEHLGYKVFDKISIAVRLRNAFP